MDAEKAFLLQEGGKAVIGADLLDDLHDDDVLVNLDGVDPILRGKLKLAGRNLPVQGLEGDAHLGVLLVYLLGGPPGELQVRALEVLLLVNETDLLLEANVGLEPPPKTAAT